MRPAALLRAEPDIEALMQAEGIAMRPGPCPRLDPAILPTLRRVILGVQLVVIRYSAQNIEKPVARVLCPCGTLYGGDGRAWLVGHVEELPDMRLWRLDRIASVDLLDRCFARREDFDRSGTPSRWSTCGTRCSAGFRSGASSWSNGRDSAKVRGAAWTAPV